MAKTLNLYQAKSHLSALVDEAAQGEEIVIAKAGKPMAKLVPLEQKPLDAAELRAKCVEDYVHRARFRRTSTGRDHRRFLRSG